jgi:methylase of polypeptide subunit release factors
MGKERAMAKRRRSKQQFTLQDRILAWAKDVRAQAATLPPGPDRELLLAKARQAETASQVDDWVTSPGLQPTE